MAVPSEADRNARLDQLSAAVNAWADHRTKYLNKQVAFSKRILKGRTGAERLNNATSVAASTLTIDAIEQFLTGE